MKFLRPLKNLVLKPFPDIQERQLVTLYQLLQNSGQSFTLTWEYILEILEIASNQQINDQNNTGKTFFFIIDSFFFVSSCLLLQLSGVSFFLFLLLFLTVIKAGFQSLQLICTDFMSFLPVPCLHRCIQTLGQYAIQKVVNK
jgi:hypothetical protein